MCPLRALIIDDDSSARLSADASLSKAGYKTDLAIDVQSAWSAVERSSPHVVLIDGGLSGATDLVRRIRAVQGHEHVYVVVELDRHGVDLVGAYAAGADDVIRKPYGRDELVARVDGVKRMRHLLASAGASGAHDWSEALKVTNLAAWKNLDAIIAVDLEGMLGASATPSRDPRTQLSCFSAEIPLSLASENIEINLRVLFDEASIERGAKKLLGEDASPATYPDLVREIANVAAGSLRRQAQTEGVVLTVGIPTDGGQDASPPSAQRVSRQFHLGFADDIVVGIDVVVFERAPEILQLGSVREGMVLVREIVSPAGAILLPAGTRMTATAISRVTHLLGVRYQVEVADACNAERRCA